MEAGYRTAFFSGILNKRIKALQKSLRSCRMCPRQCGKNRLEGEKGFCGTGRWALVSSYGPHFGEESPLVGRGGSGTIFFTHCNLGCCFCQNDDISHQGVGHEVRPGELARLMVSIQEQGCHNINFVTPSHVVAQIAEALPVAIEQGLRVPLVYNTGGYDEVRTLRLLDGVMDIYMPDCKFSNEEVARTLADASDYPEKMRKAVFEMHRQVGDLRMDSEGIAVKGLLIRHLVMPKGLAGTDACFQWIAEHVSRNTYVNIMDQYRPCGTAFHHPSLRRRITRREYQEAVSLAHKRGLYRLDKQRFHTIS